ncbi:MAG: hypothetical protein SWK90_16220 [Chloroflexota bacterium]|nr:hypothetical protein [Chloroflexota bacterium]
MTSAQQGKKRRNRNTVVILLLSGIILYLTIGLLYNIVSLYCYNVRHWHLHGGFSLPPLYACGFFFNLFLWPVYLWANLVNHVGIFGPCTPVTPSATPVAWRIF